MLDMATNPLSSYNPCEIINKIIAEMNVLLEKVSSLLGYHFSLYIWQIWLTSKVI